MEGKVAAPLSRSILLLAQGWDRRPLGSISLVAESDRAEIPFNEPPPNHFHLRTRLGVPDQSMDAARDRKLSSISPVKLGERVSALGFLLLRWAHAEALLILR